MKSKKYLAVPFVILCAFVIWLQPSYAQETVYEEPALAYKAGFDRAYIDRQMGRYSTIEAAVAGSGYSAYGDDFLSGYYYGWQEFESEYGHGNFYSGYWEMFSSTIDNVEQERIVASTQTRRGSQRVARNYRRLSRQPSAAQAGEIFDDIAVQGDYSFARVKDDTLGGKGNDQEASLFLSGRMGDALRFGLGYSHNRYAITTGFRDYRQSIDTLETILSLKLSDHLAVGSFLNLNFVDIEDEAIFGLVTKGNSFERWGGGLLASLNSDLGDSTNVGLTAALASMNKRSVNKLFNPRDTAGVILMDLNQKLSESLSVNVYGSYFALLKRETDALTKGIDGSYWTWGCDLGMALTGNMHVSLGFETKVADKDHKESRLNTSLVVSF